MDLALEAELRGRAEAGDLAGVMTSALRGYGEELAGFLGGLARDPHQGDELFAIVCEKLWRALPTFRWDCTFRVWAYKIARNEFYHSLRAVRKARRELDLDDAPELAALVRSTTAAYRRTAVKDVFARIRERLEPDDRVLLGLRVDRELEWTEIATVLGAEDGAAVRRDAATLRKRYERLKKKLRDLAREEGLDVG